MSKSATRNQLIHLLADGAFHSGESLGQQLGVSRAAIAKHIKALEELGLDVFKVMGKGYRLNRPLALLSAQEIQQHLTSHVPLEVLNVIDSTNQHLKDKITRLQSGAVCLAEAQTAGRGRHGRKWVSPFGASLYLSVYWRFADGYQAAAGLSLAIGVAIAKSINNHTGIQVALKWPNDVYLQDKKLAGVLIEAEGQFGAACDCIIGIGLNVSLPDNLQAIDQPYTDLTSNLQSPINRNQLAACLIDEIHATLNEFERSGLSSFVGEWRQLDLYANKAIRLSNGNTETVGIGRGISDNGGLIIESSGQTHTYYGGEISVRAAH